MSNIITDILKDVRKIEADFAKIERAVVRRAFRNIMNKAGTVVVRQIKTETPILTGSLKKAIRKRVWLNQTKGTGGVVSGVDSKKIFAGRNGKKTWPKKYIHLVEFGTKRGVDANPFIARAAAKSKPAAIKIVEDGMDESIRKAVAAL